MGKLVVLILGEGDFEQRGFPVTLQIGEEGEPPSTQDTGHLPPNPEILEFYKSWQSTYRGYIGANVRLEKKSTQIANFSIVEVNQKAKNLSQNLNQWLKSQPVSHVREELLANLKFDDEVRVIISTSNIQLRQLPWHIWDLLEPYPKAEIALSPLKYRQEEFPEISKNQGNILAILGDDKGINVEEDRNILNSFQWFKIELLVKPKRSLLNDRLWENFWQILFFAGHSRTEAETGIIYLNDTESLTVSDLKSALKKAIQKGLQLAIFNSCDGLGLAQNLADLNLSQIIVMREPVPDEVAQKFLKYFLNSFSTGKPFYLAVREARERLQGLEGNFPCASWLPVICQNSAKVTIYSFQELAKRKLKKRLENLSLLDRNIVIDTSYITCAEYQLFIDEKQKIGENYQPDHWESYRFIPGNSIKPIVGVRASDAEEFCQWLNEQYCQPGQKYRLPLQDEVEKYPANQQIGCWCTTEKNYEILGIDPKQLQNLQQKILQLIESDRTPENYNKYLHLALISLGIDYPQSSQIANDINLKGITEIALQDEPNLNYLISSELPVKITLSQSISDEFDLKLSSANEIARTCNINLNGDLKHIPDFNLRSILENIAPKIDEALLQEIERERKREISEFKIDFNSRRTCYYLLLVYAFWQLLSAIYKEAYQDSNFIKLLTRWRKSEKRLSDEYAKLRNKSFELYILFLLLYERRKGNIPAWEGIRIVREKIE